MVKLLLLLAPALLVGGCGDRSAAHESAAAKRIEQRRSAAHAQVSAGPVATVSKLADGDLIALTIPSSTLRGLYVEVQRCYVWRDGETRSTSMSCPHQPSTDFPVDTDNPGPDIDR